MNFNVLLITSFFLTANTAAFSCSSFLLKRDTSFYVGKNYDWDIESGKIVINKRDIRKTAFNVDNPVSWTSKYASISFNQYGQDFPCGGMNEKGLVVEALWLYETSYPEPCDSLLSIDNMQWIQYHLDVSSSVEEIITHDRSIQIAPVSAAAVHCFAADASGNSMVFEATNGVLHHYRIMKNDPPFLTNDPYKKSVKMLNKCKLFGGNLEIPRGKGSITRFIRIGITLEDYRDSQDTPIDYAFTILKRVSLGGYTKWSIVYDVTNTTVYYRSRSNRKIRSIQLSTFNPKCSDSTKSVAIVNKYNGNISSFFSNLSIETNKEMVTEAFKATSFLKNIHPEVIRKFYQYPLQHACTE